jgi:hypothetical protein
MPWEAPYLIRGARLNQRSPSIRTSGRLMTSPETTHIEKITSVMAFPCWVDGLTRKAARLSARPDNPAGRKPHLQGSVACGIAPQTLFCWLQAEHTDDRTANDPPSDAASYDYEYHDGLQKNAEAPRPLAGA